ncbi:kinesin-like protein KIF23 [Oppia nitens]|uniref:kinesin-like protein KIF23 n=1 Tax=Oppia nitens TaxID=1686743 RepID=UPI0023DB432E|nr:kinesin-like protein KIF23 [Oppia nitens]
MAPIRPKTPFKKSGPPTRPKPPNPNNVSNKEPVEVFCRLRPVNVYTDDIVIEKVANNNHIIRVRPPNGVQRSELFFKFKHVFTDNTNQKDVFENIAFPLVTDLVNGKNGLLFTYGITSSGKTYTIVGTPEEPGILPRSLDVLFNTLINNNIQSRKYVFKPSDSNYFTIQSSPDAILQAQRENKVFKTPSAPTYSTPSRTPRSAKKKENNEEWEQRLIESKVIEDICCDNHYAIFISYVEIYNNYIYDLLDEKIDSVLNTRQPQSKVLREDSRRRVYVHTGTEVEVKSANEAFELFIKGVRRRRIAHTNLNTESSRSHSVFTIRVVQAPLDANGAEVLQDNRFLTISQLSIVDLAGSERTIRTKNTGDRLREAGNINNSLMGLRNCIDILRENQTTGANKVVPYRDNKLTHLFKSYFEGEGTVKMVICVNPSASEYDETLHVMKFAETSQEVMINKAMNRFNIRQTYPKLCDNIGSVNLAAINIIGPAFPTCFLEDPEDDSVYPQWIECLQQRQRNKDETYEKLKQNQLIVRQRVAAMENENMFLKQRVATIEMDLTAREGQIKEMENKLVHKERSDDIYKKKISDLQKENQMLRQNFNDKSQEVFALEENEKTIKTVWKQRLESERQRLKDVFEHVITEMQRKTERQKMIDKNKMNLAKEILNSDLDIDYFRDYFNREFYSAFKPSNAPNVHSNGIDSQASTQTPQQTKRSKTEYDLHAYGSPYIGSNTPQTLTSVGGDGTSLHKPPVVNPRHRRSLSTGNEKWIDHRPPGTIELGTVLQPHIKNRKSVSKLKSSDILRDASKYALTHHEANCDGEVETQVFKGEVIPSSTGGAQVIFNDIETLKQSSPPGARKRTVSDTRLLSPQLPINQVITEADVHNPPIGISKRSRH